MKHPRITAALALCAGILVVSSPAFAWTCKAKNAGGDNYTAVGPIRATVAARAVAKCQVNSAVPRTCVLVACTLP